MQEFLTEWARILKPGGFIRLGVIDTTYEGRMKDLIGRVAGLEVAKYQLIEPERDLYTCAIEVRKREGR